MAVAHIVEPQALPAGQPPRKRWTRTECELLELHGFLRGRFELIDGELIDKMGKNQPHIVWLALIQNWFERFFAGRVLAEATMDVSPVDQPTSEPQPDLMVLRSPIVSFLARRPCPADVQLLIEVADTSVAFDTTIKAGLYARAGIADYWVVDINARRLLVFRDPLDGSYQTITQYEAAENVSPLVAPEASLRIDDILPTEN